MNTVVSFGATPDFTNVTAYVQGPGDILYMATTAGLVLGWNELTQTFTSSVNVGNALSSIDISSDGKTLIVGESLTDPSSNTPSAIDRVSLDTGSVQRMQLNWLTPFEHGGVSAVAFDADDDMLIATGTPVTGTGTLHFAAAGSQLIGADTVAGTSGYEGTIVGGSYLVPSADHSYVLVMEGAVSNAPLELYDTQTEKIIAATNLNKFSTYGYNSGTGDINDKTNLVLDITTNNIFVFNFSLTMVKDLSSLQQQIYTIAGGHFDKSGDYLFLWNPSSGHILAYSTQTWQLCGSIGVSARTGPLGNVDPTGDMTLSSDGRFLVLNTGSGFESIDLSTQLSLHLVGDGAGTVMHGSLGADFFVAGSGPNTFIGEGGSDTAIFANNYADYKIYRQGDGSLSVVAGSVTDSLIGVQTVQFKDVTVQVDAQGGETFRSTAASAGSLVSAGGSIAVDDSATNVVANLDSLQSVAKAGKLSSITLTDSGIPTVTVTAAQLGDDSTAIADIGGNYALDITLPATGVTLTAPQDHGITAILGGLSSQYTITAAGDGESIILSNDTGVADKLTGFTAIQFTDHTDIVAQTPGKGSVTTGNVAELYAAVLAREPDVPGLAFYEGVLKENPATPFTTFALWFLSSPEYTGSHSYAASVSGDTQFITDSYENLLHRAPETGAVPYYLGVIGQFTAGLAPGSDQYKAADLTAHATMLAYFAQSPEFLTDVAVTGHSAADTQHWLVLI